VITYYLFKEIGHFFAAQYGTVGKNPVNVQFFDHLQDFHTHGMIQIDSFPSGEEMTRVRFLV
jgi:hypothetical protein